ncbi:MAG: A/G-specific adenine glycosylase [Buchnera aphidicola (Floraphis choui)]
MNASLSQLILNWYHTNGRKYLPWKTKINPYNIWISEIMLQQTQVKTVIPYYIKFIKRFPNINILAKTTINDVLNIWSGLGYYTRAHNIHYTANIIVKNYDGQFPNNFYNIIKLPGIGRTTANAILSFGFNFYACILDGNIKRTLLRYFNLHLNGKKEIEEKLWKIIELITPIHNTNKFNQAIMDIGSLICTKSKPKCNICPIHNKCLSFIKNDWSSYPINKKKLLKIQKKIFFLIIQYQNFVFLNKNMLNEIWKGLYYFPIFYNELEISKWIKNEKIKIKTKIIQPPLICKLSHIQLFCTPIQIKINKMFFINKLNYEIWFNMSNPQNIGLPSPIKRIIKNIFLSYKLKIKDKI